MIDKVLAIIRKLIPKPLFDLLSPVYHFSLALLANLIYGFPGRKIKVVGVTGTNGKTTVANMSVKILEEAGYKVGLSSTTDFQIGGKKWKNLIDKTMAGRFATIKLISQMAKAGCDWAVLEVPSHAISQFRVWGVPFDAAVFTNLTHDHLDYHKTFQNYRAVKGKLFEGLGKSVKKGIPKISVVNADDPESSYFLDFPADLKYAYGTSPVAFGNSPVKFVFGANINASESGTKFTLLTPEEREIKISLKLLGNFNVQNALAAASFGLALGISGAKIKKALEGVLEISGRLHKIETEKGFDVIIDYAHSPDALKSVYETLCQLYSGRLIGVYGATGDRDKTKRPVLGQIGGALLDLVIITDEEPGFEDPEAIISEISPGVQEVGKIEGENFWKIKERSEAIRFALSKAEPGDVVIITGIGHQKFRNVRGKQVPWDEEKIISNYLKGKSKR